MDLSFSQSDFKDKFANIKDGFFSSKKYSLIYLALILFFVLSNFDLSNYSNPKIEIIVLSIVLLGGIFCISYYFSHKNESELYKTAFFIILIFGIVCAMLMPLTCAPDEYEHLIRAELTSQGEIIPNYVNGSYSSIEAVNDLIAYSHQERDGNYNLVSVQNATVFTTDIDTLSINYTEHKFDSAFAQNPFYGYLPQALGICIAKLLNLNVIWMLWLARICNLIFYSIVIAIAVKKTPVLKVPLIVMACIPLTVYQVSSVSIDAFINGVGILSIAYFFYLYKSPKRSITLKEMGIFSMLCLLLGLTKITFFLLVFLLLFVPIENFKEPKYYYYSFIFIIILGIIGALWSTKVANVGYANSYRSQHAIDRNINTTSQISYMLSHKKESIVTIFNIPLYLDTDLLFNSRDLYFNNYNSLYLMFLGSVLLMYPTDKYDLKSRIGSFGIVLLVYIGTYIALLFYWTPVGQLNPIIGVQPRYFLPLFALLPFIFSFNHNGQNRESLDNMIITLAIGFLALMIISLVSRFY